MEDLTEKEQIERMQQWWSENGTYVLGGIIVGIAIIVGLSQYRSHTLTEQKAASVVYEELFEAVADGNLEDAEAAAGILFADFDATVYPSQARLAMARLYMDKGRDQDAADALKAVVDNDPDSEYGLVARLRLAKIYLYQNKAEDVIALLTSDEENGFTSRYSEALGDAHFALGNFEAAREAYMRAMADNASNPTVDRPLIQMKIDDLPEVVIASSDEVADEMTDEVVDDGEEEVAEPEAEVDAGTDEAAAEDGAEETE